METEINIYVRDNVMPPLINMKNIFETLGKGVSRDINIVSQQSNNLITTLDNESKALQTEFVGFGIDIKKESIDIANATMAVAQQMEAAIRESKPAAEAAITWSKRAYSRWKRGNALGAAHAAAVALKRIMFEPPSDALAGQGALLPEILEALIQIGKAFSNLKNQFEDFGGMVKYRTTRISNQFKASGINISGEMNALTSSLKGLFNNISDRIQGGTGKVLKAIEYQDIKAEKIDLFIPSEGIQIPTPEQAPYVPSPEQLEILMDENTVIPTPTPTPTIQPPTEEEERGLLI